ncbi:MAG: hypothetical protein KIT11_02090 [Fimbriimonadaceae bacterium]|nr:hypothetical protein [Fimbriimonadaceae bacterium]QYK54839.1 MAG: hypothetical protein KF733_07445 [Fimbriimonadaceae bacterium]
MKRLLRKRQKGSALIEAMFAIFLALVCAVIFAATMPTANRSRAKADLNNLALGLAQKQMEALKGVDAALSPEALFAARLIDSKDPVAPNTYSFTNVDSGVSDSPSSVLPNGTGRLRVETVAIELRRVTVEVNWTEEGQPKTVRLGTLIADLNN